QPHLVAVKTIDERAEPADRVVSRQGAAALAVDGGVERDPHRVRGQSVTGHGQGDGVLGYGEYERATSLLSGLLCCRRRSKSAGRREFTGYSDNKARSTYRGGR